MSPPEQRLFYPDITRILSDEAGREIPIGTVRMYPYLSKPGGPYEGTPIPAPAGRHRGSPYWVPEQEQELRTWWHRKRFRAEHVVKRPVRNTHDTAPEDLEVGDLVYLLGDTGTVTRIGRPLRTSVSIEISAVDLAETTVEVSGYLVGHDGRRKADNAVRSFTMSRTPEAFSLIAKSADRREQVVSMAQLRAQNPGLAEAARRTMLHDTEASA